LKRRGITHVLAPESFLSVLAGVTRLGSAERTALYALN